MAPLRRSVLALALILVLLPASSVAADRAAGKQKAAVCASCHGRRGVSQVPSYPNLAGQKEKYLLMALQAYKAGQRKGGQATLMQGQAGALSKEDMANLAAYYASLPAAAEQQADR